MASTIEKIPSHTGINKTSDPSDRTSVDEGTTKPVVLSHDEYHLATLGYKQEFVRCLGFFESWAATFSTMNFISGIPVLFGWVVSLFRSSQAGNGHRVLV